ncbi:MAG: hypothetical protein EOP84_17915 [Verrucomicrobiaceae bacterium]|nr:MAG: hypothetical protein EOP84_17915 [Verrucomicrobiaceae bacterium]
MKTITECQPLIYGLLMAQAEHRKTRRRKNVQRLKAAMPIAYVGIGLAIVFDAGLMPWDARFWLIFSPVFVFGEWLLSTVARAGQRQNTEENGQVRGSAEANERKAAASAAEIQKRKIASRRDRNRHENAPLLLSAFQVRPPALHPPLVQPRTRTSRSVWAENDHFSSAGTATLVRLR